MNDENMTRLSGLLAGIHPIVRGDPRELTPPLHPGIAVPRSCQETA
jgi:hypothetical protein